MCQFNIYQDLVCKFIIMAIVVRIERYIVVYFALPAQCSGVRGAVTAVVQSFSVEAYVFVASN